MIKNLVANAGDAKHVGLIPGSGRSPGVGNDNPLQYSCLENPMGRRVQWATVHGDTKSQTQLEQHFTLHYHCFISSLIYYLRHSVSSYSMYVITVLSCQQLQRGTTL